MIARNRRSSTGKSRLITTTALAGLVALCVVLAGCGSNSLNDDDNTPKSDVKAAADDAIAAMVPDEIRTKGTLTVGTDASYAPVEFLAADGKTVKGFDIDLFNLVAQKLDLKVEYVPATFDTIITGVQSGKYDVGVSSFTINEDRKKQVDMVSYYSAGTQWATPAGEEDALDPGKPCGLTIAVQKGTVQQEVDLPPKVKECEAAGDPVKVLIYEKQDQATAAVVNNKAEAMLADSPVVAYAVEQSAGELAAAGDIYDSAPYGYVIDKSNADLANAILKALEQLNADGDYTKALAPWGVEDGGIDSFKVNP